MSTQTNESHNSQTESDEVKKYEKVLNLCYKWFATDYPMDVGYPRAYHMEKWIKDALGDKLQMDVRFPEYRLSDRRGM